MPISHVAQPEAASSVPNRRALIAELHGMPPVIKSTHRLRLVVVGSIVQDLNCCGTISDCRDKLDSESGIAEARNTRYEILNEK